MGKLAPVSPWPLWGYVLIAITTNSGTRFCIIPVDSSIALQEGALLSPFYEESCSKHPSADFCVDTVFISFG